MADPAYDGLCGIASDFTLRDGRRLRCKYELGHAGDHDWKKYEGQFQLFGGITRDGVIYHARRGSLAAQAIAESWLKIPPGCTCTPLFSEEGERVDFLFAPDCKAHAAKPEK
jgi:hypothetical protein